MFGLMDQDTYYHHYHDIVERYLASPSVVINIACLPDEPDVILGYSVTSTDRKALHWVFVKSAFRRMGIAKSLVPTTVVTATHITKVGASVLKKKHLSFNPFHL
jgi:GNAT superfamily N-acetyltransferase